MPVQAQDNGWIGISVDDGQDQGALVRSVETGSPAEKAGLKSGDVVIEYNKTPVLGAVQFGRLVRETPVGRTVEVKVRRDNRDQVLQVTTGRMSDRRNGLLRLGPGSNFMTLPDLDRLRDRVQTFRYDMGRLHMTTSYTRHGVRVDEMTTQLREFFGVADNSGVLVASVESGSPAEKAGLKAGDVITAVDSQTVRTPGEFEREMRRGTSAVSLRVIRNKQSQNLTLDRGQNR
jgi:serine protease Do